MSRRPGDRAAQNQATLKTLVKLDSNKSCADCKRNKHPRWASWNLGIFVCIRCSGIHRGMGTHISRVKSVDLDAWTDEQLQSVLKWGNARANKYWEAKLAPGHVPSEAKIENFIRTKYESKRWVMDGPMPDPSTLNVEGDDDVPLNIVREKAQLERSSSQRASSATQPAPPPKQQAAAFDLIGGDDIIPPARPSTTGPTSAVRPPPPKQQAPSQLLGGLDFLGGPPERPSSASSTGKSAGISRPDLKQSILSLYATAPKPQPQAQAPHERQPSMGGSQPASKSSAFGDLSDAFGGLNFGGSSAAVPKPTQTSPPQSQPSLFSTFGGTTSSNKSTPAPPQYTSPPPNTSQPPLAGGSFFDAGPKPPPKPAPTKQAAPPPLTVRKVSNASDGFGEFSSAFNPSAPSTAPINASSNAASSNGLLDLSSPASTVNTAMPAVPSQSNNSVFNLSAPKAGPASNYSAFMQSSAPPSKTSFKNTGADPWGSNEWSTNEPPVATPATGISVSSPTLKSATGADFGWGNTPLPTSNPTKSNLQTDWSKTNAVQSDWNKPSVPAPVSTQQAGWGAVADTGGWGDPTPPASTTVGGFNATPAPPKITPEDDFGDWGSAPVAEPTPATTTSSSTSAPKVNSEDLFGNVWG